MLLSIVCTLCNLQGAESILTPSILSFRFQQQHQQMGDRTEEAQDHIDESYGGGGGGGGGGEGHHAASDGYMVFEEFASPFKQLSMLNAAKEMADLLPEVTPSRQNGIAHGDDDVRNENQVLHQNCYDPEVARVAMMQRLQEDKHSSSSSSSSQVAVTSETAHEVYGRESATAKMLQPQAFCVLRKSKRVSNKRSEEKGGNNKTREIVRKAVIDVLAHTDNMGDALSRASHALGDEYSLWNQMMKQMELRGARRQALQVFRFLQVQPKFEMREQIYVTIMSILGREGKLGLVKDIFYGMKDENITPTVHSYSVLISG
jgi:pentatricopeptide repeat protein